jgi:hypothetical protein
MAETISPQCKILLQMVGKYPDVTREKLLTLKGITEVEIGFLLQHDLIREQRDGGRYRVSHLGQMALKRGL